MHPRNTPISEHFPMQAYITRLQTIVIHLQEEINWLLNYALPRAQANNRQKLFLSCCFNLRQIAHRYKLEIEAQSATPEQLLADTEEPWKVFDTIVRQTTKLIDEHSPKLESKEEAKKFEFNPSGAPTLDLLSRVKEHILYRGNHYCRGALRFLKEFTNNPSSLLMDYNIDLLNASKRDFLRVNYQRGLVEVNKVLDKLIDLQNKMLSLSSSSSTSGITQALKSNSMPEEKLQNILHETDAQYELFSYVEVKRIPFNPEEKFRKVLVLDLDDTLAKSLELTPDIQLLFFDEWAKVFKDLPQDVAVHVVTSRLYPDVMLQTAERIISELEERVGRKFVRSIIYTCGESKDPALEGLYRRHLAFETEHAKANLGLVDDALVYNIEPARKAGFSGFHAQANSPAHILQAAEFIKPGMHQLKRVVPSPSGAGVQEVKSEIDAPIDLLCHEDLNGILENQQPKKAKLSLS